MYKKHFPVKVNTYLKEIFIDLINALLNHAKIKPVGACINK